MPLSSSLHFSPVFSSFFSISLLIFSLLGFFPTLFFSTSSLSFSFSLLSFLLFFFSSFSFVSFFYYLCFIHFFLSSFCYSSLLFTQILPPGRFSSFCPSLYPSLGSLFGFTTSLFNYRMSQYSIFSLSYLNLFLFLLLLPSGALLVF